MLRQVEFGLVGRPFTFSLLQREPRHVISPSKHVFLITCACSGVHATSHPVSRLANSQQLQQLGLVLRAGARHRASV